MSRSIIPIIALAISFAAQAQDKGIGTGIMAGAPTGTAPTHLGLRGATVDIDMTQAGGKAALTMASGALVLPGVFEDPLLPLDRLSADLRWQIEGSRILIRKDHVIEAMLKGLGAQLQHVEVAFDPEGGAYGEHNRHPGHHHHHGDGDHDHDHGDGHHHHHH